MNGLRAPLPPLLKAHRHVPPPQRGLGRPAGGDVVVKFPLFSAISLRCSRGSPGYFLTEPPSKFWVISAGNPCGRSRPFSADVQIIPVLLQLFRYSSRCHSGEQVSGEKKSTLVGKGQRVATASQRDGGLAVAPLACLRWAGIPRSGFHFPFCQEISLGIKQLLFRVSKKVLFLPVPAEEGAKSCPEPVPTARTSL